MYKKKITTSGRCLVNKKLLIVATLPPSDSSNITSHAYFQIVNAVLK